MIEVAAGVGVGSIRSDLMLVEIVQLFEIDVPFCWPLARIDVAEARSVFASLMDRCLLETQALRLDQDDVLLERVASIRDRRDPGGAAQIVALSMIGEPSDWVASFDACRESAGLTCCDPDSSEVLSLGLCVMREKSPPIYNPFDPPPLPPPIA